MKVTGPKCGINGIHFLHRLLQELFGRRGRGKSLYSNNCYLYKRTALDISECEVSIIVIHLKGTFCDGEEMEEIAPILQLIQNEVYFIIVTISQLPI